MRNITLKFDRIWFFYFLIKFSYMFLAVFVYSKFTVLGDTARYIDAGGGYLESNFLYNSTSMMDTLGHTFSILFGTLFANFPFVLISFYGVYYSVSRLSLNKNQLILVLFFLSFPSFGVWTSIVSKEAIGVFYMGIILGCIFDYLKKRPVNKKMLFFAFYLCLIFKPQYMIGLFSLGVYVFVSKWLSLSAFGKFILFMLFFILSFLMLYLMRDEINALSFLMSANFDPNARSTRDNTFWVVKNDVFWHAPYGMYIAFFGPTINEAKNSFSHLFAWLESFSIVICFAIACLRLALSVLRTGKLNIYLMGLFFTATLWILFVQYPFGALNPGAAIRYRESFYAFLVVLFYFTYLENYRSKN